ncbi:hypothetical protein KFE25_013653 [Diacronema lutheri]|uniref:Uncharacterized protein n=1 Tax=Diacronema lutheri TaxID=2081491 RepID=A0A8J5XVA4_DIALT|nr:hypothetical protein KFE25_013653 [Diacronema lutheri]
MAVGALLARALTTRPGGRVWDKHVCEEMLRARAKGRGVLIVGGTAGLGRALAERLSALGADVTVIGSTFEPAPGSNVSFISADLSLMRVCDSLLEQNDALKRLIPRLDDVVFSGAPAPSASIATARREETREGLERGLAACALSHVVLLRKLAALKRAGGAKRRLRAWVVGVSSERAGVGDADDFNAMRSFSPSTQRARAALINEALVHVHRAKLSTFALNPGFTTALTGSGAMPVTGWLTGAVDNFLGLFVLTTEAYAGTTARLMLAPELGGQSGVAFDQAGDEIEPNGWCVDKGEALIAQMEALAGEALAGNFPSGVRVADSAPPA